MIRPRSIRRLIDRVLRRLDRLNEAVVPADINAPGFSFRRLHGTPARYTVHVNGLGASRSNGTAPMRFGSIWRTTIEDGSMSTEEYPAHLDPRRQPTHPGALLREDILPALRLSVTEAARSLGISRQTLHNLLSEKGAVTPARQVVRRRSRDLVAHAAGTRSLEGRARSR